MKDMSHLRRGIAKIYVFSTWKVVPPKKLCLLSVAPAAQLPYG
jgi:hypothetical protein